MSMMILKLCSLLAIFWFFILIPMILVMYPWYIHKCVCIYIIMNIQIYIYIKNCIICMKIVMHMFVAHKLWQNGGFVRGWHKLWMRNICTYVRMYPYVCQPNLCFALDVSNLFMILGWLQVLLKINDHLQPMCHYTEGDGTIFTAPMKNCNICLGVSGHFCQAGV